MDIIGIDVGGKTGLAYIEDGTIAALQTETWPKKGKPLAPFFAKIARFCESAELVVIEKPAYHGVYGRNQDKLSIGRSMQTHILRIGMVAGALVHAGYTVQLEKADTRSKRWRRVVVEGTSRCRAEYNEHEVDAAYLALRVEQVVKYEAAVRIEEEG